MPVLAGWLTGEQVPLQFIEQTLSQMEPVLAAHGGTPARVVQPGMGLISFADSAHAMQKNDEPAVLDWVPNRRTFVYRRPLSGAHPLYYVKDWPEQGNLFFASEIKALLAVGVPRMLRLGALNALQQFGFIPPPWTAFGDVSILPAGYILRWQHAKLVVGQATDFRFTTSPPTRSTQEEAIEGLTASLAEHTKALLPPHEQLVAIINGDAASALPALLTSRHTEAPYTAVSFGYKNERLDSWIGARRVAEACNRQLLSVTGVDVPEFWVGALAEIESPCIDAAPLGSQQLFNTISTQVGAKVALSSLGTQSLLNTTPFPVKRANASILTPDVQQKMAQEPQWEETVYAERLYRQANKFDDKAQRDYYLSLHMHMANSEVRMAHSIAMHEGLALRSPYLHSDVLESVTSLPKEVRNERLLAQIVAKQFPALEKVQPFLPLKLPVSSLLRVGKSDLLQATLSREAIQATGIFDEVRVEQLLKKTVVTRELFLVFTTQLFCKLFEMTF